MSKIKVEVSHEDITKWEESVQKFVRENPGRPVPNALLRWLFNLSTVDDLKVARERADILSLAGLAEAAENGKELGTCDED